ncbi:hypothetical protein J8I26_22045 [Herbaspirillum sp. LeCh32-8]|uniref:hypothetical protein n=1 Tax=Herbaspirillum sp. LeCh32-8 TaxID=2821356 RepID=UPI001AE2113E|nr:hypothetical protein [Herbaspirillum sp. LeCh32-8]MBP0600808.1 hypothetical protein [Herbaspirillum sp. LeCh32-8]
MEMRRQTRPLLGLAFSDDGFSVEQMLTIGKDGTVGLNSASIGFFRRIGDAPQHDARRGFPFGGALAMLGKTIRTRTAKQPR